VSLPKPLRYDEGQRLTNGFIRSISEDALGGRIPSGYAPTCVGTDDAVSRRANDCFK
jgi:hypothetical protein